MGFSNRKCLDTGIILSSNVVDRSSPKPQIEDPVSPRKSFSAPSDHNSDISEPDYDALLKQIPGFESYDFQSTPSTRREQNFPRKDGTWSQQSHDQTAEQGSPRLNSAQDPEKYPFQNVKLLPTESTGRHTSNEPQDRFSVHVLTGVVPQLYVISRKRNRLLQLQFKIETVHRKLARARESLLKELENTDAVIDPDSENAADLRRKWRDHSKRLRRCCQDLAKEEAALEPLELKLTQVHHEIITLEDDLHASLTGGAKPGDSDASYEDRAFEIAAQQLNASPDFAFDFSPADHFSTGQLADDLQASGIHTKSLTGSENHVGRNLNVDDSVLRSRQPSPDKGRLEPRKHGIFRTDFVVRESQVANESANDRSTKFLDITLCGSLFQEAAPTFMSQTALAHHLYPDNALVDIRKNDLKAALGYSLQDLEIDMDLITKLKKPMNSGVAHALTKANLPRVHTRQMISLWGKGMSQNSAFETGRTLLYGGRAFEKLTGQNLSLSTSMRLNPLVVLQLVQDVRQLKVPLDATMGEHDDFLKVDRDLIDAKDNDSLVVNVANSSDNLADLGSS